MPRIDDCKSQMMVSQLASGSATAKSHALRDAPHDRARAEPEPDGVEHSALPTRTHLAGDHAAASRPLALAAGANGSATGYFRGRPRGRLRATTTPPMNSSPPQTPHGSRRSSAPGQADLPDRAVQAQRLRLFDVGRGLGEEQLRVHQTARQLDAGGDPLSGPPSGRLLRTFMSANFLVLRCRVALGPRHGPGNTKAVIPGDLGFTALEAVGVWLHRRTTGGGPTRVENLVIGDVTTAEIGDMSALVLLGRDLRPDRAQLAPARADGDQLMARDQQAEAPVIRGTPVADRASRNSAWSSAARSLADGLMISMDDPSFRGSPW